MIMVTAPTPDDVTAIAALLAEMDTFYGDTSTESDAARCRQIEAALFGPVPAAYALTATIDGAVVGIATYSFLWPAVGLTRSLYLKELYVARTVQRRSVGRHLMDGLQDAARASGCSRVEWTTDVDNSDAQRFYESLGFTVNSGKLFYRASLAS